MPSGFCIHYVSKFWRPSIGHSTGKCQSFSQISRRVVPKNVLTIRQLHACPKLVRSSLKSCMLVFSIMGTKNFQMSKLGLEKEDEQTANICWIIEKAREFQKSIYLCFINYAKAFDWVNHDKLWKALREMGIPDHMTCLLRNLYAGQEEQFPVWNWLFQDQERSKTGLSAVTVCSTYMLSTSWEIPGWMSYKLKSR